MNLSLFLLICRISYLPTNGKVSKKKMKTLILALISWYTRYKCVTGLAFTDFVKLISFVSCLNHLINI